MRERSPGKWELVLSAGINPATGRYHRVVRAVATTSKRAPIVRKRPLHARRPLRTAGCDLHAN
jgi:hypothetical protein